MCSIRVTRRIAGITALAAELGISKGHLSRVAHGERRSKRLEAALEERGLKIQRRKVAQ